MVNMHRALLLVPLCFFTIQAKHEEIDGHALYQVEVQTLEQVQVLSDLAKQYFLDVWRYAVPGYEGQVLVPRELRDIFEQELHNVDITYKVAVENIKESVDLEDQLLAAAASTEFNSSQHGLPFDRIHRYEAVDRYMVDLAKLYPTLVQVVSAGKSFRGRDIKYLKISTTRFQDNKKPVIFVMSLVHAREWITLPVTLYAIKKLVIDITDQDLVRDIDWIIMPIANPDGYEFSHTNFRFWRKNRATTFMPLLCPGVDLNRNFDIFWGTASDTHPCSDIYHGRRPFSEPESRIIRDILMEHRNRMELFLDIHSFGSMILFGFGNGQLPPNALTLNLVGVHMARGIDSVKWPAHPNYVVGNIAAVIYYSSGSTTDYAQSQNIPLSYCFELPRYRNRTGYEGFLVDPDFIEQAGYETWEGIKVGARWVVRNTRMKRLSLN